MLGLKTISMDTAADLVSSILRTPCTGEATSVSANDEPTVTLANCAFAITANVLDGSRVPRGWSVAHVGHIDVTSTEAHLCRTDVTNAGWRVAKVIATAARRCVA
jgi:hypothetical protein